MAAFSTITLNFDSNITKIVENNSSETVTTSGQPILVPSRSISFTVTLTDGYVLDTVVASTGTIKNVTDNRFEWTVGSNVNDTITLTSKAASGTNKLSVDLTTLSGWANLAPGNHTIKIVAKGTGYRDSEKSAAVSVTKPAEAYTDCLTFTGESSEFTLKASNKTWDGTLQWSTDHNTWTTLTGTEEMQSVGKKLYLRGKSNTTFFKNSNGVRWQLSARAGCSGNIQTLLDYENPPTIMADDCYHSMFYNCANLTTAPNLPATTLAENCYAYTFGSCTRLTTVPNLPATTLAERCYYGMFNGCVSLTTAPVLPATTLPDYCYHEMFYGCSKLKVNTSSGNKIFTCPSTIPTFAVSNMFTNTGGTFKGTPTAGNTYYWTE